MDGRTDGRTDGWMDGCIRNWIYSNCTVDPSRIEARMPLHLYDCVGVIATDVFLERMIPYLGFLGKVTIQRISREIILRNPLEKWS